MVDLSNYDCFAIRHISHGDQDGAQNVAPGAKKDIFTSTKDSRQTKGVAGATHLLGRVTTLVDLLEGGAQLVLQAALLLALVVANNLLKAVVVEVRLKHLLLAVSGREELHLAFAKGQRQEKNGEQKDSGVKRSRERERRE